MILTIYLEVSEWQIVLFRKGSTRNSGKSMKDTIWRKYSGSAEGLQKTSKEENRYVTYTGLPLKGLLLPDIELFKEVSRKYDTILQLMDLNRILKRIFLTEPGSNRILNKYLRRT